MIYRNIYQLIFCQIPRTTQEDLICRLFLFLPRALYAHSFMQLRPSLSRIHSRSQIRHKWLKFFNGFANNRITKDDNIKCGATQRIIILFCKQKKKTISRFIVVHLLHTYVYFHVNKPAMVYFGALAFIFMSYKNNFDIFLFLFCY